MTDPDFNEIEQQIVGYEYGASTYGTGVYGGEAQLLGDGEEPQETAWTEISE